MSTRELKRAGVLARVVAGTLTLGSAATLMGVSYRQAKRLRARYRDQGAAGLRHGSAGQASNRATSSRIRKRALALIRAKYSGTIDERFGPTLAAEHLTTEDGLTVDHETLRRWMLADGLWSRMRKRSPHRRRRERKAHFGELVQKAIHEKLDRLDEAFLYERTIDIERYDRQRDRLREELTLVQMDRHRHRARRDGRGRHPGVR